MEYVNLKNSDLQVSRICMGGCPMGGYGWGEVQENELIQAVNEAIDNGVNFFDTADTYGLGQSEITLGKAVGKRRDKVIIATKFGVHAEAGKGTYYDNSPEYIVKCLEASLKRLGTDYVDLYQIHYRDGVTPMSEVVHTLDELKKKGLIRYYGLSNVNQNDYEELKPFIGKFVSFQNEYSLACRKNEDVLINLSEKLELTPMTWGSLGQGILTGKYDSTVSFGKDDRRSRDIYVNFHGDKLLKNLEIVDKMREISKENGKSLSSIAIRFILDYIKQSVVLVGVKRPQQLYSNIEATDWNLTAEQLKKLIEISN